MDVLGKMLFSSVFIAMLVLLCNYLKDVHCVDVSEKR